MRRRLFSKRLLPGGPSRSHIKRWIGKQVAATPDRQNVTHKGGNWNGLSVEKVLAWLDASRYILEQNKIHHAREAFANIDRAMQNKLVQITNPKEKRLTKNGRRLLCDELGSS